MSRFNSAIQEKTPGQSKLVGHDENHVMGGKTASIANRRQERRHDIVKGLALGQSSSNEAGQRP